MGPCCKLTYEKYLNEDGSVDKDAVAEAMKKRGDQRSIEEVLSDLCHCDCHIKGSAVLH